jgi:twitching motility protein PilJ
MAEKKGKAAGLRYEYLLLAFAGLLIMGSIYGLYYVQSTALRNQTWVTTSHQMASDINDLIAIATNTKRGEAPNFQTIAARSDDLAEALEALRKGNSDIGIDAMPSNLQPLLVSLDQAWTKMKKPVEQMQAAEQPFSRTLSNVAVIADAAGTLSAHQSKITDRLTSENKPKAALTSSRESTRLERMIKLSKALMSENPDIGNLIADLNRDAAAYPAAVKVLAADGAISAAEAKELEEGFATVAASVTQLTTDSQPIKNLTIAADEVQKISTDVLFASDSLEEKVLKSQTTNKYIPYASLGSIVLALILIVLFVTLSILDLRRRSRVAEERDTKQQQAILGLLDDITNLSDGDLTVDVNVTEDFTGAIADSLNYTIGNLRNVVGTINSASAEIGHAADNTQNVVLQMNEASERQAREITDVTRVVTESAQSLQQVSARAEQLAQQAQNSVQIAHNGAETVGRTIQGMAALREQIQDTSKRIKRLGESSQEIGNIIEFINDIADQTNTLALNASIQAAMAGDAGRGFAVVADEVQRLAERAGSATRQIETLVKTIQADTNEAIVSMERSTSNVVTGAKSAEEAGQALTQVEVSSQQISQLIQQISGDARNQSANATKIAGTMQLIRDIAVQTSGAASQTARSVGDLTVLSGKLRESVAGFKLADEVIPSASNDPQEMTMQLDGSPTTPHL